METEGRKVGQAWGTAVEGPTHTTCMEQSNRGHSKGSWAQGLRGEEGATVMDRDSSEDPQMVGGSADGGGKLCSR